MSGKLPVLATLREAGQLVRQHRGDLLRVGFVYIVAFFVIGGRLTYVHNFVALAEHRVQAAAPLTSGPHQLQMRYTKTGDHRGTIELLVDGNVAANGEVPRFTPTRFSLVGQGLTCGYSVDCPVCDDYTAPFEHHALERVVVAVDGEPFLDPEGEAEVAITTQ